MFYCNKCGKEKGWPTNTFGRSYGPCEICGKEGNCNDVCSSQLPMPTPCVNKDGTHSINKHMAEHVAVKHSIKTPSLMPQFYLERHEDVSGVSGTGIVAHGIVLPSGNVVVEWAKPPQAITIFPSIGAVKKVHGHDGKTEVVYIKKDE